MEGILRSYRYSESEEMTQYIVCANELQANTKDTQKNPSDTSLQAETKVVFIDIANGLISIPLKN